jgi:hypothetical protein
MSVNPKFQTVLKTEAAKTDILFSATNPTRKEKNQVKKG